MPGQDVWTLFEWSRGAIELLDGRWTWLEAYLKAPEGFPLLSWVCLIVGKEEVLGPLGLVSPGLLADCAC